jgi:hypothetical protein
MTPLLEEVESGAHRGQDGDGARPAEVLPPLAPADILRIESELVPVAMACRAA